MLEKSPSANDIAILLGSELYNVWEKICSVIDEKYDMDRLWDKGGKAWTYEYKYRRGGKTLCTLYMKEKEIGFMVILGKAEREKVETIREGLSDEVQKAYDEAKTFHDGKWVMFKPTDTSDFDDYLQLLAIRRKPNRRKAD